MMKLEMLSRSRRGQKGFSLVEILVATGILAYLSIQVASMFSSQIKEVKAVGESLAAQDLYKDLIRSTSNSDVCKFLLEDHTFDAQAVINGTVSKIPLGTSPIYINMAQADVPGAVLVKKGSLASSYSTSLYVSEIGFEVVSGTIEGTRGVFKGNWVVEFDQTKTVRPNRPIRVASIITANVTDPTKAIVETCMNEVSSPFLTQSCPTHEVLSGYDSYGAAICIPNFVTCAAGEAFSGIDSSNNPICIRQVITGSCPPSYVIKSISATAPPECVTTLLVEGVCGPAHGTYGSTAPATGLCASGKATAVNGTGPWSWACAGENGGDTQSCLTYRNLVPINGTCGSVHNTEVATAPTTNLCNSGDASAVSGSGPWTWTCNGKDGGTTVACVANKPPLKIIITCATYGRNCGVGACAHTGTVKGICDNKTSCSFTAGNGTFGDPRDGCQKMFDISYTCGTVTKSGSYGPRKHENYNVTLFCN